MTSTRSSKSRRGKDDVNSENELPEVVHANDIEIQKLRELHESASLPVEKRRRIKKAKFSTESAPTNNIDLSVLEGAAAASNVSAVVEGENGAKNDEVQITTTRVSSKKMCVYSTFLCILN